MIERPFSSELSADGQVLAVSGLLDEISVADLRNAVCVATGGYTRDLVIDLSDVDFLPSVALGVLVGAMKASSAHVSLMAEEGCLAARVLGLTGLPFVSHPAEGLASR